MEILNQTTSCRVCGRPSDYVVKDIYHYCNRCIDKCICIQPYREEWCNKHWYFSQATIDAEEKRSSDYQIDREIKDILNNLIHHIIGIDEAATEIKNVYIS